MRINDERIRLLDPGIPPPDGGCREPRAAIGPVDVEPDPELCAHCRDGGEVIDHPEVVVPQVATTRMSRPCSRGPRATFTGQPQVIEWHPDELASITAQADRMELCAESVVATATGARPAAQAGRMPRRNERGEVANGAAWDEDTPGFGG